MMCDPVRRQLLKETVMPAASRVLPQRAAALVSALRRWRTYALDNQFHVRAPTPLQLSAFFKAVAAGGPYSSYKHVPCPEVVPPALCPPL